jgi:hypothetical protein
MPRFAPLLLLTFILAIHGIASPGGLKAAAIVQWGSSATLVSAYRNDTVARKDFILSLTVPANPAIGANYYADATAASPLFFATAHNSEEAATVQFQIANDLVSGGLTNDVVRFNYDSGGTSANTSYGLILWTRYGSGSAGSPVYGFLNGGDDNSANVVLTGLSATAYVNTNTGVVSENRFVIRLGGSFYVSANLGPLPTQGQGAGTIVVADPTQMQWFAYDPLTDVRAIGAAATVSSFAGLDAVGLLAVRQSTQRYNSLQLVEFSATAAIGTGENRQPVAVDDNAATSSGGTVLIDVLANDSDPDADPIGIESVTTPTAGSAVIQGSRIAYRAPEAFVGVATFDYTISDSRGGTASATVTVTVAEPPPPPPPPPAVTLSGRDYRLFFIGNSLTRGLPVASRPDRAMLEGLFALRGDRLFSGVQMGAAVNLDEHWDKTRFSTGTALQLNHLDDRAEVTLTGADWRVDPTPYGQSFFRDYRFALQGYELAPDGTILSGRVFDGVVLQTFQSFLESSHYSATDRAKGFRGDRAAINDFVRYARGDNPAGHTAARQIYIYTAWPYLGSIESRGLDPDGDGIFSFSEFFDQPYAPATNPSSTPAIGTFLPSRDYVDQLMAAVFADTADLPTPVRLIPVGEILATLDVMIRADELPGVENYFIRNAAHFLEARLNGQADLAAAGFHYIYPPNQPTAFTSDFVREQGVKNFYADHIHMNDQPHNDERAGTIGAYVAAAAVQTVVTGEHPGLLTPEEVAAVYTWFDPVADGDLIRALQDTIWAVLSADPRTGVVDRPPAQLSYGSFTEVFFTESERSDRSVSAPDADPAGSGLPNGIQFLLHQDPFAGATADPLEKVLTDAGVELAFIGLTRAIGMQPRIEVSSDLRQWRALRPRDMDSAPLTETPGISRFSAIVDWEGESLFARIGADIFDARPTSDLVRWGPGTGIVSAFPNLTTGSGSAAVDLSTPSNPFVGVGYVTTSPVFFAAATALSGNSVNNYRISNGGDELDTLRIAFASDGAARNDGVFTVIWQQRGDGSHYGFLNGGDIGSVRLANIELRGRVNAASLSATETRFIVRIGDAFYISNSRASITAQTFLETVALAHPAAADWYRYDPANHALIGEPVVLTDFDNVTAVGFSYRTFGAGSYQSLDVAEFRARFFTDSAQ